ncbi:MAG: hydroxymethylglutaryl-CoA lyase [Bacteroidia bacterium]|nr:hydroxymethylglutaryl-CoA lyase [Bacteroidia bacterium]
MIIVESPREAFQAWKKYITSEKKTRYINALLKAGFHTVEAGSIVSPKVIPQMADTFDVLSSLDKQENSSEVMVLVVNKKGAELASSLSQVNSLAFPFSFSPIFVKKNLNATITEAHKILDDILDSSTKTGKKAVIYISMAFGNPYGDEWSIDLLMHWIELLVNKGIDTIPLSNVSVNISPDLIRSVFSLVTSHFPKVEFGLHLHTSSLDYYEKVEAAYNNGCRRFDTVINGMGGCPMTGSAYMANLKTQDFISFLQQENISHNLHSDKLEQAITIASEVFN